MRAVITVNPIELYTNLAGNSTKTGFISYPATLYNGQKVAGLYRGFGNRGTFVKHAPEKGKKGFKSLEPVSADFYGNVRILD